MSPVTVMKMSPSRAASSAGITSKPSITASSACSGSTSHTITWAPRPFARMRDAAAAPAVAEHDHALAGDQDVGRADDAVERRLAGAVAVVEQVLGVRLVDRDDREAELALGLERPQPDHAGRRLLGAADHLGELVRALAVQDADHVGAVVHRDLRVLVADGVDVRVVGLVVLAVDRRRPRRRSGRPARPRRRPGWRAGSTRRARRRRRPPISVRTRFAVSVVTCRQRPSWMPSSGFSRAKRSRIEASTGMWRSAHSILAWPASASARSATS